MKQLRVLMEVKPAEIYRDADFHVNWQGTILLIIRRQYFESMTSNKR